MLLRRFHDCAQSFAVSNVSRIDSDLVRARLNRRKRQSVVKVNIRYQGHFTREFFLYARENFCGLHIRHCDAYDFAACFRQSFNLSAKSLFVCGIHIRHGLYCNRRAASNQQTAASYLFRRFHTLT